MKNAIERYFWKVIYFFNFYIFQPVPLFHLYLERRKFKLQKKIYIKISDLTLSHKIHNKNDLRLLKRIKIAKELPELKASIEDINNLMYSSSPIKVKGNVVLDGCGRYFAIRQAKGDNYEIEVYWMSDES